MKKNKIMWVVEWEGTNIPHKSKNNLVICIHPNTDFDRVGKLLELLYIVAVGSEEEKIMYARGTDKPPAFKYRMRNLKHIITCGHNPHLVAQKKPYPVEDI